MAKKKKIQSHHVRSVLAASCGAIGLLLIIASFFAVWLNRTLTDTNTYVSTVAPLIHEPAIQEYVADKTAASVTKGIAKKAKEGSVAKQYPATQLAPLLISPVELEGKSPAEINTLATAALKNNVQALVSSPDFADLWADANREAHQDLVTQLKSGASEIKLDLRPTISALVVQLKATKLSPLGAALTAKDSTGVLPIQGDKLSRVQNFYNLVETSAPVLIILTITFLVLAVILSVHHKHTAFLIAVGIGAVSLLTAILIWASTFWKMSGTSAIDQQAAAAVAKVLLRNLQLASLGIGVVCLGSTLGYKLYKKRFKR